MSEGEGNVHSAERDTAQTPSSNDIPLIHSYRYRHKKKCVHVYTLLLLLCIQLTKSVVAIKQAYSVFSSNISSVMMKQLGKAWRTTSL